MTEPKDEDRLKDLKARIARKRAAKGDTGARTPDHHSQAQLAWRMVIELVAGLMVGFGIGIGLDALFGTRPFLLILFTLLGFAAGVRTMLRTAKELAGDEVEAAARAAREEEDRRRG